jgi:hypothetical protein
MKTKLRWMVLGCALGLVAGIGATRADDGPALPAAVRDAVLRAHPGATFGDAERERVRITVYEVEVTHDGRKLELVVSQDGTIIETERHVDRGTLPAPVGATLDRAIGQSELRELVRKDVTARLAFTPLAEPSVSYEAEWRRDGKKREVEIAADGTLEDDDGDEDEDEDEDD